MYVQHMHNLIGCFHSADVNVSNKGTGWTPCHCAAFQGHGKVLLHLSGARPDISLKDSAGRCVGTLLVTWLDYYAH